MFGVDGVRVLSAERDDVKLGLLVDTDQTVAGCPQCGVIAVAHGRRVQVLHDTPSGAPRSGSPGASVSGAAVSGSVRWVPSHEAHELAEPRCPLTRRAAHWATDALAEDDTTVNALAHRLGVDWHTVWEPVKLEARRRLADPSRLSGVCSLGVDEHVWRPGRCGAGREVTCMVDLTTDSSGKVRARLLDLVLGRSGTAYAGWLHAQDETFRAGIKYAALDRREARHGHRRRSPTQGAARTARTSRSPGRPALQDPWAAAARRRTPHRTPTRQARVLSRRWRPERRGRDGLVLLPAAPADLQQPQPAKARRALAEKVIASFPSCPIPEVARLGRTLRAWGSQVLAYFDTGGVSNGGTEAINMLIEKARRLAHSYRNLENYRLRMLLATGGQRSQRRGTPPG